MATVTTNNQYYTDIANAIRGKNGTETQYKPSEMAAAISAISGGGEPEPPDDGKTRLYITVPANAMPDRPPPRNQVPLYIQQTVANGVTIDWGDGTEPETLPGTGNVNTTHTYEQGGDYVISLEPAEGCELGFGDGTYNHCVLGGVGRYDFFYLALKKVYIWKNCVIGDYSFYMCKRLEKVTTKSVINSIGYRAFYGCSSIKEFDYLDGVNAFGDSCFINASTITSFIVYDSTESIGDYCFQYCYNLSDVYLYPVIPPTIQTNTFKNVSNNCTYHVRPESLEAYKAATNWTTITDQIVGDLEV